MTAVAVSWSEPREVGAVVSIVGAGVSAIAATSALLLRWWRRRRTRRELERLEARVLRQSLDSVAHLLNMVCPGPDGRWTDQEKLRRQMFLVMQIRDDLFKADGFIPPERTFESQMQAFLTRTQAIRPFSVERKQQDMFREGEEGQ